MTAMTEYALERQKSALGDSRLDDQVKLMFCKLIDGIRGGWLFSDPRWNDKEKARIKSLADAKYITLEIKSDNEYQVGLNWELFKAKE